MRTLIPRIVVYPHRLIDGSNPVLRAQFTLTLTNFVPGARQTPELLRLLTRELTVDLFEPPQRERYRQKFLQVMAATPDKKLYEVAEQDLKITPTAVQRIAQLVRTMEPRGVDDPYEPLTDAPEEGRLRRHHHPRYRFEPLEHFPDQDIVADVGRGAA